MHDPQFAHIHQNHRHHNQAPTNAVHADHIMYIIQIAQEVYDINIVQYEKLRWPQSAGAVL